MSWDFIEVGIDFIINVYHAGGAKIRWVVWIWCAFIFLYVLLGKYDAIHKKDIIEKRQKEQKNYFYALHLFGVATAVIEYGYLLDHWAFFIPIANGKMIAVCSTFGFIVLLIGFCCVLLGRLYLNSYWGKDIYKYDATQHYELVKECIYGTCRHPIYFGQVCMCFGTALIVNNWIIFAFAVLMLIMNIFRAMREDKYLKNCFQDEWEEYRKKVSFFVPFL